MVEGFTRRDATLWIKLEHAPHEIAENIVPRMNNVFKALCLLHVANRLAGGRIVGIAQVTLRVEEFARRFRPCAGHPVGERAKHFFHERKMFQAIVLHTSQTIPLKIQ